MSKTIFTLRNYKHDADYKQLIDLLHQCNMYYDKIDNPSALQAKIKQSPKSIVVAEVNHTIIGCCYFCVEPTNEFILHLCVDSNYRNQGVGTAIMNEVEHRIVKLGTKHEPILLVEETNVSAISFYQKRGWQAHENKKYFMMKKTL